MNDFDCFLKDFHFFEDHEGFLENLEMEMATKDPCMPLLPLSLSLTNRR